eukprot:TRINITY_DN96471_c0_g1_i1.p1 TRINITY_DN96471_c0_g1~~TRINITY_DN96471_c0_g1_i1.p1  ORF type:complete len:257 (-),score=83.37 TRINITY_DN96471_c0_g1_i1:274-1044(-)
MPVNYSKFDHIEDSDDEKPDAKTAELERRRKLAEEMQKRLGDSQDEQAAKQAEKKPDHQTDRFSYAEADCDKLVHELVKTCVAKTPSIKVGNGVVSVSGVEKVEGDAAMFKVRGQIRHTWDVSFKVKWTYQWMGTNFDQGPQRAEGAIAVCEFTDATTLFDEKSPPILRKSWTDKGSLDQARQREVERSLGGKPWPPAEGTLMAGMVKMMEIFVEELPLQTAKAQRSQKENREAAAQEEAEELAASNGVRVEELEG